MSDRKNPPPNRTYANKALQQAYEQGTEDHARYVRDDLALAIHIRKIINDRVEDWFQIWEDQIQSHVDRITRMRVVEDVDEY